MYSNFGVCQRLKYDHKYFIEWETMVGKTLWIITADQ